jgi:hypothetical protein
MADMGALTGKVTHEYRTFVGFWVECDNCEERKLVARFRVATGKCAYGGEYVGWIECSRCVTTGGRRL